MAKVLMKGNEALGEAAIRAGCVHFFGYPITPASEIAHTAGPLSDPYLGSFLVHVEAPLEPVIEICRKYNLLHLQQRLPGVD